MSSQSIKENSQDIYRCLWNIEESSQRIEKDSQYIRNNCETLKLICKKSEKIKNLITKNKKTCKTLRCVHKASM